MITLEQQTNVEIGLAAAQPFAAALGPNAILALTLAQTAWNAVLHATQQGRDITDAELDAAFDKDAAAKTADDVAVAARQAAEAQGKIETDAMTGAATGLKPSTDPNAPKDGASVSGNYEEPKDGGLNIKETQGVKSKGV